MPAIDSTPKAVARAVLVAAAVVIFLYVLYLLRKPLSWLVIAAFIAVAAAGPVNVLQRRMRRGLAISIVYLLLILIPIGVGALLIPPLVGEVEDIADNAPEYVNDVEGYVQDSETLSGLNEDYDITGKLQEEAAKLPEKIPDAAGVLSDIGVGVVNSVFAGVTILILSIFMIAGGPRWIGSFIQMQRPEHADRIERTLRKIANAVGNYVGGALVQATLAGIAAYVMLIILGAPFAGPLALLMFFFDLIPVIGATIGSLLVGIVMMFVDFPVGVIVWIVFAILYQQVENYLIQPQIQQRATKIEPFVVLVAVLFGTTLFGVIGALLAIPIAASLQIAIKEWRAFRRDVASAGPAPAQPPPAGA